MTRRWDYRGRFIIRYSPMGLCYLDDRWGYKSVQAAKRRIDREAKQQIEAAEAVAGLGVKDGTEAKTKTSQA